MNFWKAGTGDNDDDDDDKDEDDGAKGGRESECLDVVLSSKLVEDNRLKSDSSIVVVEG